MIKTLLFITLATSLAIAQEPDHIYKVGEKVGDSFVQNPVKIESGLGFRVQCVPNIYTNWVFSVTITIGTDGVVHNVVINSMSVKAIDKQSMTLLDETDPRLKDAIESNKKLLEKSFEQDKYFPATLDNHKVVSTTHATLSTSCRSN